ncbi:MAG: endonuclease [Candidatus Thiodiazotropha taylori]|nr:endonuclease [Candidatus Thiodiazotropha taylori]MCW4234213.1 endonuclease [Candidatus Thiodiazotropha taylori]
MKSLKARLEELFEQLFAHYGAQNWWPAETPFEVMLGAVLTQNTAWTNVEKAILNLKDLGELNPQALLAMPRESLAEAIRPSGYFNLKAERVQNLCALLVENRELHKLADLELRAQLLGVTGIGPETADDILLYAFQRPVFVIDAYTRRLLGRIGWVDADVVYEDLRQTIEQALAGDAEYYNEFHALIVIHAKRVCCKQPRCSECHLSTLCSYTRQLK